MAEDTAMEKREEVLSQAERTRTGRSFKPNVDIIEMEDELVLMADMPGATPDSIDIDYEKGQLSIHGRIEPRQDERNTNHLLHEYGVGDFYRTFQIGEGIDSTKIAAQIKNGVLTLHLPKADQVKPRKIQVTAS